LRAPWTEDLIELLTFLWNENKHSAKWIAWQLGPQFTRNSVIGKANRLGLERKGYRNKIYYGWKHTQKPRQPKVEEEPMEARETKLARMFGALGGLANAAPKRVTLPTILPEELPEAVVINIPSQGPGVGYFEAGPDQCRWFVQEGPSIYDLRLCGQPIHQKSYCKEHCRIVYNGPGRDPRPPFAHFR